MWKYMTLILSSISLIFGDAGFLALIASRRDESFRRFLFRKKRFLEWFVLGLREVEFVVFRELLRTTYLTNLENCQIKERYKNIPIRFSFTEIEEIFLIDFREEAVDLSKVCFLKAQGAEGVIFK